MPRRLHANALPPNVEVVIEFFFLAGKVGCACRFAQHALYFRELYPCHVIPAGARPSTVRHANWWRSAAVDGVYALQPELQHRHHARHIAGPRAPKAPASFQNWSARSIPNCRSCRAPATCRAEEFSAVLDSPAEPSFRWFAPAVGADHRYQICHRFFTPQASVARTAATLQIGNRAGWRCSGAGAWIVRHRDNAPISCHHEAAGKTGPEPLPALETGTVRTRSLRRQRNAVRGVFWGLIDGRHSQGAEVDGVLLHGAFFSRAEIIFIRASAWR